MTLNQEKRTLHLNNKIEETKFVQFVLKLNINKKTFKIPKNNSEIKEITLNNDGSAKESIKIVRVINVVDFDILKTI